MYFSFWTFVVGVAHSGLDNLFDLTHDQHQRPLQTQCFESPVRLNAM